MTTDEKYMWRCIQLAGNGRDGAAPNPMVGAVIVCDGKIIGEGYHIKCGGPHAEVNAIRSVRDESLLLRSTIYVSLEPCAHYGKTPPCADLIIEKRIPRVVIGCQDPFAKVNGLGIKKLMDAGVDVKVGVLEKECKYLNRRFMTFHSEHRPYVVLKWAESLDGYIDVKRSEGTPVKISTDGTTVLCHKRRSEVEAIMVGTNTALLDNPSLTVRSWNGRNPMRVVVDRTNRIPPTYGLKDGSVKTLVYTEEQPSVGQQSENPEYVKIDFSKNVLPQILADLYGRGVQSLMVEGGAALIGSFIESGLWDEAFVEVGTMRLGDGVRAPQIREYCSGKSSNILGAEIVYFSRRSKDNDI
jgi:diaminohydroxyphosphoribosylaminopyrimidine deaminase/5-amino-6-(5-phosphoribosylamino)uracil reductase